MDLSFLVLAAGQTSQTTEPAGVNPVAFPVANFVVPLIIVFAVMYLFVIAPQRKREKARRGMLDSLSKGADVVTIGGVHGKVWQVKDDTVVIEVDDDVRVTFSRGAIARVGQGDENEKKS